MSKIALFLNQSPFESSSRVGALPPELRGSFAERFGMPLMLAAFAFSWIAALATQV